MTPIAAPTTIAPSQATAVTANGLKLARLLPSPGRQAGCGAVRRRLQSGYFTYPRALVKTVSQVPGLGGDVTGFTQTVTQTPLPVDQNAAWQAVNKALNVNLKLQIAASGPDYTTKVATLIAGDLPDLFYLQSNVLTGSMPAFLKAACTDLSPYVGGDAVKDVTLTHGHPSVEADGLRRYLRHTDPAAEFPVRLERSTRAGSTRSAHPNPRTRTISSEYSRS